MDPKNIYPFLAELNRSQYEAAVTTEGPLLVLAGAGSGKTKTLVSRVAYMIASQKANPEEILVLTFTNKAAREMKERGIKMVKSVNPRVNPKQLTFSTFHSWGLRFLREHLEYVDIGLKPGFSIASESEKKRFAKDVLTEKAEEYGYDVKPRTGFLGMVDTIDNEGINAILESVYDAAKKDEKIESAILEGVSSLFDDKSRSKPEDAEEKLVFGADLIRAYKEKLREANMVDFGDLLVLPLTILSLYEQIKIAVMNRYRYVMVDEFQDTNLAQMKILEKIVNPQNPNICVVGDDFQSIYGWRGAKIENILGFDRKYSKTKIVNLSKNYRSGSIIVDLGNRILEEAEIKHEAKENLVPAVKSTGKIFVHKYESVESECAGIVSRIKFLRHEKRVPYESMVILYRVNSLAKEMEIPLIKSNIPYTIIGGTRFLDKKFVQILIGYMHLLLDPNNDSRCLFFLSEFEMLTEKQIAKLRAEAAKERKSVYEALKNIAENNLFGKLGRITEEKKETISECIEWTEEFSKKEFSEIVENLSMSWIRKKLNRDIGQTSSETKRSKALSNSSDLEIFIELASSYGSIDELLESVYLEESDEEKRRGITLMSIHKSKGLEFDVVFLMGAADGILPHFNSLGDLEKEEEERRLAYVAVTRAKQLLFISYSLDYHPRIRAEVSGISRFLETSLPKVGVEI